MIEEIENAIKELAKQIKADMKGDDALKKTQAMLNLAHTIAVLKANNIS